MIIQPIIELERNSQRHIMAKDRLESEKREKKEKKHKHSETNGVTKDKSEKAEKKEKKRLKEAAKEQAKAEAQPAVDEDGDVVIEDAEAVAKSEDDDKEKIKHQLLVLSAVPFANPMADDKTMRRVLRGVKKGSLLALSAVGISVIRCTADQSITAAKHKTLRRGVKEVVKSLRKSPTNASGTPTAVVVLAADISPFDVISHIPVLCEEGWAGCENMSERALCRVRSFCESISMALGYEGQSLCAIE